MMPKMTKPILFRRWCCFAVIALSFALKITVAWAAEQEELESFLKTLQNTSDQVFSFSSEFIQEKHLALFSQPVLFTGKLVIVRPDRLRWEFTSPISSVLLLNGDQGTRCNDRQQPEHFQLASDPIMKTVAEQLWLWLGGDYNRLHSLYNLEKEGESTLVIRPRDSQTSGYITAVSISFDAASLQPRKVEISEPGGDLTRILFGATVINGELPENLFTQCLVHE